MAFPRGPERSEQQASFVGELTSQAGAVSRYFGAHVVVAQAAAPPNVLRKCCAPLQQPFEIYMIIFWAVGLLLVNIGLYLGLLVCLAWFFK